MPLPSEPTEPDLPADGGPGSAPARRWQERDRVHRARLQALLAGRAPGAPGAEDRTSLGLVGHIGDLLHRAGQRRLLSLTVDGSHVGVAIGVGDIDRARRIALIVPGLGQTGTDLGEHLQAATALTEAVTARSGSPAAGPPAATILWCDYRRPVLRASLRRAQSVASYRTAAAAGVTLASFLTALPRTAEVTVIGHSYGSLVAAAATRRCRSRRPDRIVLVGSPGIGVDRFDDIGMPAGQVFALEAPGDMVAGLNWFGADPGTIAGIRRLSTRACPRLGTAQTDGHAHYLAAGTTAQWNIAAVVAGDLDVLVDHDPGAARSFCASFATPVKAVVRALSTRYHRGDSHLRAHVCGGHPFGYAGG